MASRQHLKHKEKSDLLLLEMPDYVKDYARIKESEKMSPSTLLNYLKDFKNFFLWLMEEGFTDAKNMKDIPYSVLEKLPLDDAISYFDKLTQEYVQISKDETKQRELTSVNRQKSALRSLFKYLTTQTEKDGNPLFLRNVMQKIKVTKPKETLGQRASKIHDSVFHNQDDVNFLYHVKFEYEKTLTKTQLRYFLRDKERDYAILSLFLGSGIRLNELAELRLRDINFKSERIRIIRKGGTKDSVAVIPDALEDLKDYLSIRKERYGATDEPGSYVFVARYKNQTAPLSVRTIQDLVRKYTKDFNDNLPMSPHKLRHTYATNLMDETKDLTAVMEQLGHTSTSTTVLYVHSTQEKMRKASHSLGKRRERLKNREKK